MIFEGFWRPGGLWEGSRGDLGGVPGGSWRGPGGQERFLGSFCQSPGGYLEGSRRPRTISLNLLSIFGALGLPTWGLRCPKLGAKMQFFGC